MRNRLLEIHAAETQLVGMGRIVGGIASIVSFFFSFSFFLSCRACVLEGGRGWCERDREGEGEGEEGDGIMNIEY